MNTEKKEITNLDFNFNILNKKEEPIIKPKKSYKKIISLCVLSLFLSGGFYGYKQVDKILNAPVKETNDISQQSMMFKEHMQINPEEQAKIDKIYSGRFKGDSLIFIPNKKTIYYFNNSVDFKKANSLIDINYLNKLDYAVENKSINEGKFYFRTLLEDKIMSDLFSGKSPKDLAISKFIDPLVLNKYQSIYEEIYPQIIQSDTSGDINYQLTKNYEFPSKDNKIYTTNKYCMRFLAMNLIENSNVMDLKSNNNIKLWD